MKMQSFKCDKCKCFITNDKAFPYENGWHYLYCLEIKVPKTGRILFSKDKHFCSKKCLQDFITEFLGAIKYE